MVRATRSSVGHQDKAGDEAEKPITSSPPVNKAKIATKKRKRSSGIDMDDVPNPKHSRSEDGDEAVRDDDAHDADEVQFVGDLPLRDDSAQKILDILEMADTQGLLDRVFPLDDVVKTRGPSSPSGSNTPADSYSLRMLLKESDEHPLRVYRSAIKQLHPISSQPRSRISPPAAQQLRFCQLALSLIDMASQQSLDTLLLNPDLVCPSGRSTEEGAEDVSSAGGRRKYALVQKLPTGEWWTSLNLDVPDADSSTLANLNSGHADLVAVLPSASTSSKPPPTLSSLEFTGGKLPNKMKPPGPRRISCGSFLDYGPNTSFAPTFDNNGGDLGIIGVTSAIWRRHGKERTREKARVLAERYRKKLAASANEAAAVDSVIELDSNAATTGQEDTEREKQMELLRSAFGDDTENALRLLDSLECEESVEQLLKRNARALLWLEEQQRGRLGGESGGSSTVEVDSEEWRTARSIMDSLALLASLRPRLPNDTSSAIIPPASVLRSLQRTLPSEPSPGWYGSLSSSRGLALRDDTTLRVKAASTTPAPAPLAAQPTLPLAAAPTTQSPSSTYTPANYSYANYSQQYQTAYGSQTQNSYFPMTYNTNMGTPAAQKNQTPYASQFKMSQYTYGPPWYQSQTTNAAVATPTAPSTPAPGSRKDTPQPIAPVPTAMSSTYTPYGMNMPSATPVRAVANTIASKMSNGWMSPSSFSTPSTMAKTANQNSGNATPYPLAAAAPSVNGYQPLTTS